MPQIDDLPPPPKSGIDDLPPPPHPSALNDGGELADKVMHAVGLSGLKDIPGGVQLDSKNRDYANAAAVGMGNALPMATGMLKGAGVAKQALMGSGLGAFNANPQGGVMDDPDNRGKAGAVIGGLSGLLLGGGQKLLEKFGKAGSGFSKQQADAYVKDPAGVTQLGEQLKDETNLPQVQDQAIDAIQNSRKSLRAQGLGNASQLSELLKGKQAEIDPQQFMGVSPELDQAVQDAVKGSQNQYGNLPPGKLPVDAQTLNDLKRQFQEAADFRPMGIVDKTAEASAADAGKRAFSLRKAVEGVDPAVSGINQKMQDSMLLQKALRQGQKAPLAFSSTQSPDRMATIMRAEQAGAGGIRDFGDKYGAAKMMSRTDVDDPITRALTRSAGRTALRVADKTAPVAKSPLTTLAIINSLFGKKK